ncbi:hypothetical protein [Gracilibacillus kekensis]|uniref:Immunity protein 17 n=1 Tax=Gracilibacillus kekensis TaxID=1027249 RepID=A0A1M7IVJ3_9BACI|nr:hypothetical protein [Gracilibacillus kekensis]SHM44715.1 hypothetical protein SAMN05216179_0165 [Gracilibacillus kekensis]
MSTFAAIIIIVLAVLVDYFWLDYDKKRWGWMKKWSKRNKGLLFIGFIFATGLIYFGLSLSYFQ